jgi:hypothetical protein
MALPATSDSRPAPPIRRPIIETTAPERYRVQLTIGKEGHDRLRRLQDLLRREISNQVKRAVVRRDGGQCAFVAADGRRCTERAFLEFHHITPYAQGGLATVENISLRCRRHNQYEAALVFGPPPRQSTRPKPSFEPQPGRDAP